MIRWSPFEFLRFVVFLIAGIVYAHYQGATPPIWAFWLVSLLGYWAVAFLSRKQDGAQLANGLLAGAWLFFSGQLLVQLHDHRQAPDHLAHISGPIIAYQAEIVSEVVEKPKTFSFLVEIRQVKTEKGWQPASGRVILYAAKDSLALTYGQILLLKGQPEPILPAPNPGEFDYRDYMALQRVHHRQYIPKAHGLIIKSNQGNALIAFSHRVRQRGTEAFLQRIPDPQSAGVALALVFGIKDHLDAETKDAYSDTGAMHVLAVSGLHVGIIFGAFGLLLGFLKKRKMGKWLFLGLGLLMLWGYALITGFSPSVLRAVTMFSFVLLGTTLGRKANIYNVLALSAFVLLCFDPLMVFQVGFQLSYLAVLGIVYMQPKIYAWFTFRNKAANWAWQLTTVALAAQLATSPIGLYYFHQFPTYFFLSNLVVIPLSGVVLQGGIVLFAIEMIGLKWLASMVGWVLNWLIFIMNYALEWLKAIPGAVSEAWYISLSEMWLLYLILLAVLALFAFRHLFHAWLATGAAAALCLLAGFTTWEQAHQSRFLLYVTDSSLIPIWIQGNQAYLLNAWEEPDSTFAPKQARATTSLQAQGVRQWQVIQPTDSLAAFAFREHQGHLLVGWGNRTWAIYRGKKTPTTLLPTDYHIAYRKWWQAWPQWEISPGRVAVGGKIFGESPSATAPPNLHILSKQGAFVVNLDPSLKVAPLVGR